MVATVLASCLFVLSKLMLIAPYRPGKPQNRAAVLMQQLQLHLTGSKLLDLKQLCIQKSSAVWSLQCDICVLVDDGALLDACLLAAVAALSSVQLPEVCVMASGQVATSLNPAK